MMTKTTISPQLQAIISKSNPPAELPIERLLVLDASRSTCNRRRGSPRASGKDSERDDAHGQAVPRNPSPRHIASMIPGGAFLLNPALVAPDVPSLGQRLQDAREAQMKAPARRAVFPALLVCSSCRQIQNSMGEAMDKSAKHQCAYCGHTDYLLTTGEYLQRFCAA